MFAHFSVCKDGCELGNYAKLAEFPNSYAALIECFPLLALRCIDLFDVGEVFSGIQSYAVAEEGSAAQDDDICG